MTNDKNTSKIVNFTDRANSFSGRYDGTGTDFKIYFDTSEDLEQGLINVYQAARLNREMKKKFEQEGE